MEFQQYTIFDDFTTYFNIAGPSKCIIPLPVPFCPLLSKTWEHFEGEEEKEEGGGVRGTS